MKKLIAILLAMVTMPVSAESLRHITAGEILRYAMTMQTTEDYRHFATEFKRFTGVDFSDTMVIKLKSVAYASAMDIDFAESRNIAPVSHQPRHCRKLKTNENDKICYENWAFEKIPAQTEFTQKTKLWSKVVTSDINGLEEAANYCSAIAAGVQVCVINIDGDRSNHIFFFSIKGEEGSVANLYLPFSEKEKQ